MSPNSVNGGEDGAGRRDVRPGRQGRVYQIEGNDLEQIKWWFNMLGEEVYSLRILPGKHGVQVRFNDRDWSPSLGMVEVDDEGEG